jgi:hypothetical protein
MARKIAISGSRNYFSGKFWLVHECIATEYRKSSEDILFLVGDCPTGVDRAAKSFLETAGWSFREFFADWAKYGKSAGPIRNHEMIDYGAELLIAFPDDESRGTKDCAIYAHSKGVEVYFPELDSWTKWAAPIATMRE